MPVTELNHYLIRSRDIRASRDFYVNVLGLSEVPRPDFPFPGYWLGSNGGVQVHLAPNDIQNREVYYLGTPTDAVGGQSGAIDHVAFLAEDHRTMTAKFDSLCLEYRPRFLRAAALFQIFIKDPDGITIELNFHGVDPNERWSGEDYEEMLRS